MLDWRGGAAKAAELGTPGAPGPPGPAMWAPCVLDCAFRVVIFAIRLTRRLLKRGSWLLFRQLSTARWISPRLPLKQGFSCANAQPTVLHSVS